MITFNISTGLSAKTRTWKNSKMSWTTFVEKLSEPYHTRETWDEFMKMSKDDQSNIKDVGGYVGGYLKNGKRSPANVVERQIVTLDIDFAESDFWDLFKSKLSCAAIIHGTHKCKFPDLCRFRLIVPLDRSVTPDEYAAISRKIAEMIGLKYFDNTTYEVNRLMFWQSTPKDVEYYFREQKGEALSADSILDMYFDWTDQSEWPTNETIKDFKGKIQEDPLTKDSVVGDFCRAYSISEVIEEYLSDVYETCAIEGRYTFIGGTTHAGAIVYDDKYIYSHHGTDPSGGFLCNSFDLVRLHKFGNDSKSFNKMAEFASADGRVKRARMDSRLNSAANDFKTEGDDENFRPVIDNRLFAQSSIFDLTKTVINAEIKQIRSERFNQLFDDPGLKFRSKRTEKDPDWATKMDTDRKGNYLATSNNLNLIFTNDPVLDKAFVYNSFSNKRFICKKVPWRHISGMEAMRDSDYSGLRNYIECVYGIAAPNKVDDALTLQFENNSFNPVKEYLRGLTWDGVARIDTLLHDFFGVEQSEYHKQIMRKMLAGAVNRVINPGCKFDLVMMFTGAQGVYKSTFIRKLGKGWTSDSFNTVSGKEAFEQLQGAWLIEIAELSATRKAEVEAVKHFISKCEDTYRPAYGRTVECFPRQCVFFGSTNEKAFLRDRTGNRRYLPVHITQTRYKRISKYSVADDMTEDVVDQIWAEAVELVLAGEKTYLEGAVEREAELQQTQHMEYDERIGVIMKYLETPRPPEWETWPISERRLYLDNSFGRPDPSDLELPEDIAPIEIWCECFHGDRKDYNQKNSRFIGNALESMGYEYYATKLKGIYGRQRCYRLII